MRDLALDSTWSLRSMPIRRRCMRRRHRHQSIRRRLSRRRDSPSLHLDCRGSARAPSPPSAAVQPTSAAWRSRRRGSGEGEPWPARAWWRHWFARASGLQRAGLPRGFSAPGCRGGHPQFHVFICSLVEKVVRDKLEGCRKSAGAPLREASKQAFSDRGRFGMLRPTGIRLDARISAARASVSEDRESA